MCFDCRDKTLIHRKQNIDLIPADSELERTLRSLRKTKRTENSAMAEERQDQTEGQRTAARRHPIADTMEDFWRPIIQDEYSAIRQPAVDANNFELKPALITMVQQQQFTGHPTEDPNEHLGRFLKMANTVKLNGSACAKMQGKERKRQFQDNSRNSHEGATGKREAFFSLYKFCEK